MWIRRILDKLRTLLGRRTARKPETAIPEPMRVDTQPRKVPITIGLDFGTCSTKCVLNLEGIDEGKDRCLAVSFPSGAVSEGTLCISTTVGLQDRSLVFGEEAEKLPTDRVIRSFKMAIPCMGSDWGAYKSPFMIKDKPGYFKILEHELSAVDIAALYLAVVIRQIQNRLFQYLDNAVPEPVYLNLAAPLDQLDEHYESSSISPLQTNQEAASPNIARDTRVTKSYRALGQWCLRLSEHSQEQWELEKAVAALSAVKDCGLLPRKQSPAYVVPETLAAINGYLQRDRTPSGRFLTFDVGAGTTDVSVFWLEKHDGTIRPWYYASGSLHMGMDDIDRSLKDVVHMQHGLSLRRRREALQASAGGLREHRQLCDDVVRNIRTHKRRQFGIGYGKEPSVRKWGSRQKADVTALLIGGGCQTEMIRKLIEFPLWENSLGAPASVLLDLERTDKVLLLNGSEALLRDVPSLSEQAKLLIIAEGLANKIVDILPFGITDVPLVQRRKRRPIPPDLWFVGGMDPTWEP